MKPEQDRYKLRFHDPINFFRIFFGVCGGTKIFPKLLNVPLFRCMLHLFLLSLLCSIFIAAARTYPVYRKVGEICYLLASQFGEINMTDKGIVPEFNADKTQSLKFNSFGRVDYFPAGSKIDLSQLDEKNNNLGFIWTPALVTIWLKNKDKYMVVPLVRKYTGSILSMQVMNISELEKFMVREGKNSGKFRLINMPLATGSFPHKFIQFQQAVTGYIMLIFFVAYFFTLNLLMLVLTGIFTIIYSVFSTGLQRKLLNMRSVFIVCIYAGFPPMVIASFFPAFNLPLFDYQLVFSVSFMIYMFMVFNRIQRTLLPKSEEQENGF